MKDKKYKLLEIFTSVLLVLSIILVVSVLSQVMTKGYVTLSGYSMFKVVTGSMEPTIKTDSLLVCEKTNITDIETGDIICFESTNALMLGEIITHRVIAIDEINGVLRLTTKGDANTVEDAFYVTHQNLIGKVVWYSEDKNVMASMISFMTGSIGFLSCIVFPVIVISTLVLKESMKSIKKDLYELKRIERMQLIKNKEKEELEAKLRAEIRKELGLDEE